MKTFPLFFLLFAHSLLQLKAEDKTESLLSIGAFEKPGDWSMAGKVIGSTSEKKWKGVEPGKGILFNGKEGKSINIVSKARHGDVDMDVEFMIPKGSNSGLYFMQRYEVQILDSYGKADKDLAVFDCGAIYERWDDSKENDEEKGFEGTPPSTNASSAPGTWQRFQIRFRAPRFDGEGRKTENARFVKVVHNGVVIQENVEVTGPTRGGEPEEVEEAPLMIQGDHGPVAFRKLDLTHRKFE